MQFREDVYLGQESLESVYRDIEVLLYNGSKVSVIAKSLLGTDKAELIISKWHGEHVDSFSDEEQIDICTQYINEQFKYPKESLYLSSEIKEFMKNHHIEMEVDDYSDFLTELINSDGYLRVSNNLISLCVYFKPYMDEYHPNQYEKLTKYEIEVGLIRFIKKHLSTCSDR
jgi:hypothetical protein